MVRVSSSSPRVRQREADGVEEPEEPLRETRGRGRARPPTRARPSSPTRAAPTRRICRREAPIVRSVANSRVRWAIVIDSELAITKAPTNSAMPPKASRNVCRKLGEALRVARVRLRLLRAAAHLRLRREDAARPGRAARTRVTSGFREMRMWSSFPTLWKSACAVGRSKPASVAPPMSRLLAPNLTRPETRNGFAPPCASTLIMSPTLMSFLLAVLCVDHDLVGLRPGAADRASAS